MEQETVGNDLHGGFNGEDDEEEILQFLLWEEVQSRLSSARPRTPALPWLQPCRHAVPHPAQDRGTRCPSAHLTST